MEMLWCRHFMNCRNLLYRAGASSGESPLSPKMMRKMAVVMKRMKWKATWMILSTRILVMMTSWRRCQMTCHMSRTKTMR